MVGLRNEVPLHQQKVLRLQPQSQSSFQPGQLRGADTVQSAALEFGKDHLVLMLPNYIPAPRIDTTIDVSDALEQTGHLGVCNGLVMLSCQPVVGPGS